MVAESLPDRVATEAALGEVWREHRRYVLDVAYRMLGSVSEAEDVIQDVFARLLREDLDAIEDVRGWLVVAVSRRCLDQLRSARVRREVYVGPWLPEPLIEPPRAGAEPDPADRVTLDDSVRMALLIVLERLSPAERAAFVLHDVFQFSFDDVAGILDRSPTACRQLASRARRHVRTETSPTRFQVEPAEVQRVAERFVAAAASGEMDRLIEVLAPNVTGLTDSGGVFGGPREPIVGRRLVATLLAFLRSQQIELVPMPVNGEAGALAFRNGRLYAVLALSVRDDGLIDHIHGIANPAKLAYAAAVLGVPLRESPPDRARRPASAKRGRPQPPNAAPEPRAC